jgi:hypothetical protein
MPAAKLLKLSLLQQWEKNQCKEKEEWESSPHQPHHQPEPKRNQQTSMWLGCSIPQCAPEIHGM